MSNSRSLGAGSWFYEVAITNHFETSSLVLSISAFFPPKDKLFLPPLSALLKLSVLGVFLDPSLFSDLCAHRK